MFKGPSCAAAALAAAAAAALAAAAAAALAAAAAAAAATPAKSACNCYGGVLGFTCLPLLLLQPLLLQHLLLQHLLLLQQHRNRAAALLHIACSTTSTSISTYI